MPRAKGCRLCFITAWSLMLILLCLSPRIPFFASAQLADEAALRLLTENFFTAYRNSDFDSLMLLWSEKSPEMAAGIKTFQQNFSANKIELKSFRINRIKVEDGKATVRIAADINALDPNTGKATGGLRVINRTLHCVKEAE